MDMKDWTTYILPAGLLLLIVSQLPAFGNFEPLALAFYWYFIIVGMLGLLIPGTQMLAAMDDKKIEKFKKDNLFVYPVAARVISVLVLAYYGWATTSIMFALSGVITLTKMNEIRKLILEMDKDET